MTPIVDLLVVDVSTVLAQAGAQPESWLGEEESKRLAAMGSQKRRRQFIAGHWLARSLAAERTTTKAGEWILVAASTGAPAMVLRDGRKEHGLHVSISHSGESVAVAVAAVPIGIDLEFAVRPRNWLALASQVFSFEENKQLRLASAEEQQAVFLRCWALKEASGKRDGTGLQLQVARKHCALACDEKAATAITWQFDGGCVALAGVREMHVKARGIPEAAKRLFWTFDASASIRRYERRKSNASFQHEP